MMTHSSRRSIHTGRHAISKRLRYGGRSSRQMLVRSQPPSQTRRHVFRKTYKLYGLCLFSLRVQNRVRSGLLFWSYVCAKYIQWNSSYIGYVSISCARWKSERVFICRITLHDNEIMRVMRILCAIFFVFYFNFFFHITEVFFRNTDFIADFFPA